jgi:hypothetical protein
VGGDYFDVIDLPGNRTLFALADVSGKGMAAALLASNIQALVRGIASTEPDALAMAGRINAHGSLYPERSFCDGGIYGVKPRFRGIEQCQRRPQSAHDVQFRISDISRGNWLAVWIVPGREV